MAMFFSGCSTGPELSGPKPASHWAYAPATVAVHPLSRFRNPTNPQEKRMIVVHVMFLDGDGFACRGVGELTVSLTSEQHANLSTETLDLEDSDINWKRFDNVTRTYRVHFDHLPETVDRVWIQATFLASGEGSIKSKRHLLVSRQ
jgi:hypothetical protein